MGAHPSESPRRALDRHIRGAADGQRPAQRCAAARRDCIDLQSYVSAGLRRDAPLVFDKSGLQAVGDPNFATPALITALSWIKKTARSMTRAVFYCLCGLSSTCWGS